MINRFDVFLVCLDPTQGHEIKKARPCVVVSPNELNYSVGTIIIAPMTTQKRAYPTRVPVDFGGKRGHIVLDQIRTVDKERLIKNLGHIDEQESQEVLDVLQKLFAP